MGRGGCEVDARKVPVSQAGLNQRTSVTAASCVCVCSATLAARLMILASRRAPLVVWRHRADAVAKPPIAFYDDIKPNASGARLPATSSRMATPLRTVAQRRCCHSRCAFALIACRVSRWRCTVPQGPRVPFGSAAGPPSPPHRMPRARAPPLTPQRSSPLHHSIRKPRQPNQPRISARTGRRENTAEAPATQPAQQRAGWLAATT